jgi:hypothetical protein
MKNLNNIHLIELSISLSPSPEKLNFFLTGIFSDYDEDYSVYSD